MKRRFFVWVAAAMLPFFTVSGMGMSSGSGAAALDKGVLLRVADVVITAADLSVPIYPGAQQAPGAFKTKNANGFAVSAAFVTRATRNQVVSFYRAKLAGRVAVLPTSITTTLAVSNSSTDKVMITVLGSGVGTRITIMHTIRPAAK